MIVGSLLCTRSEVVVFAFLWLLVCVSFFSSALGVCIFTCMCVCSIDVLSFLRARGRALVESAFQN